MENSTENKSPDKIRMSDLKTGDKFLIPHIGGMNIFIKQSDYHGFTEYHYVNSQKVKTTSVSDCTIYRFNAK